MGPGLHKYRVEAVQATDETKLEGGLLSVNCEEIEATVSKDPRISDVRVSVVGTGERVRLVHVLDSVLPTVVGDMGGGAFPGLAGPASSLGLSHLPTRQLSGVLVTVMGRFHLVDGLLKQLEGIIDMDGEAKPYSPLSDLNHVAMEFSFEPGVSNADRESAIRSAMVGTAERLALVATTTTDEPHKEEADRRSGDPQPIAHICQVSAGGPLWDTLIVGRRAKGLLPTVLWPMDLARGAVVCADYRISGHRNLTCLYQDNPVFNAIQRFGKDDKAISAPAILMPVGESDTEKQRSASMSAHLAQSMGAKAAVITAATGGNAHVDVMLAAAACNSRGIPRVVVLDENCGQHGTDLQMVHADPSADTIISTGNVAEVVRLPAMERVLGGSHLIDRGGADSDIPTTAESLVETGAFVASTNEIGSGRLRAVAS